MAFPPIWWFSSTPPKSYAVYNFFSQPTFSLKIMENCKFWQNENRREQCDFKKMIQNVQFFSKSVFFWRNHEHLFSNRWVKRKIIFIFYYLRVTEAIWWVKCMKFWTKYSCLYSVFRFFHLFHLFLQNHFCFRFRS